MAKPRIFVSSTFYDLKHVRASLEIFIRSLGYEPILSEKGDIAYTPELPLDESCYREAQNSDIYVLIIGGRYGSEVSENKSTSHKEFFDRYESITKREYKSAADKDIPVYVLIEKAVYAEYQTFQKNKDNEGIQYAHVDSVNVFRFIEEILIQTRNNPVHPFDSHSDIEVWLKEQWAGLFRELIQRTSGQKQLASLSSQVGELAEINTTLKHYLEELLITDNPKKSRELIEAEAKRLDESRQISILKDNPLISLMSDTLDIEFRDIISTLEKSNSVEDFTNSYRQFNNTIGDDFYNFVMNKPHVLELLNHARTVVGLPKFNVENERNVSIADTQIE